MIEADRERSPGLSRLILDAMFRVDAPPPETRIKGKDDQQNENATAICQTRGHEAEEESKGDGDEGPDRRGSSPDTIP